MTAPKAPQPNPIEAMNRDELQAALEKTQAQIATDENEYSTLTDRMAAAAEAGDDGEWVRLQGLHGVLPAKLTGTRLRALSIRILLAQAQLEAAEGAKKALTDAGTMARAQAQLDAAKQEFNKALYAHEDARNEVNDQRRELAALKHERHDLQASAAKPRRVLSGAL